MIAQQKLAPVSLRSVALPYEHGGWGLTLEPIALGLWVAPTWAGLGLGFFALCAFLIRHPLKLWFSDLRRGERYPRTIMAGRFALAYGGLACTGLLVALFQREEPFWLPLLLAAPLGLTQLSYDTLGRGRNLLPELSGAVAMSSVVSAIALAGGMELGTALGLWLVLGARAVVSIYSARTQVLRARGVIIGHTSVCVLTIIMLLASGLGAVAGLVPKLAFLGLLMLAIGTAFAFSRPPVPARVVGWSQVIFGLIVVLLTALGFKLGI